MTSRPVAVVTGAARGIGRSIARELLDRGYLVLVTDLNAARTEATAAALGDGAIGRRLDVTDHDAVTALVADVEATHGAIEVWVNNAGVMPTGRFVEQPERVRDLVIDVDYRAVVHATGAVLPGMLARGRGTVVQVASATGVKPMAGLAVYSGAKSAVIIFTEALAREMRGSGVRLGVVLPYLASTEMGAGLTAQRGFRPVTADQVARAAMRVVDRGARRVFVPRALGPMSTLWSLLPRRVQDLLDDALGSDRIGLGGDLGARRDYLDPLLED